YLDAHPDTLLAGLEHLDERYLRAVGYATKASRSERPRMVPIADIASDDEKGVGEAASQIVRLANARGGEGFIAVSAEARKKFWLDRARTVAIAKHTNAFKINEDVVIPLPKLGEYSDGIERINIELSIQNKLQLVVALENFLEGDLPLLRDEDGESSPEMLESKRKQALEHLLGVRMLWKKILENLDSPVSVLGPEYADIEAENLFRAVQEHKVRVSWKRELKRQLSIIFTGREYTKILERMDEIHKEVLRGRVFVALHMHAGDGNVHTNLPVNSDHYEMLQTANRAVDRIMALARSLDGVISGEHGIGITKLDYLTDDEMANFWTYKEKVDPEGRFNRGKLMRKGPISGNLDNAYTPSFNLMGHESIIMEQTDVGEIAHDIKDCLRCGKCKPVCSTHVPRANLLYSPRNKILSTSLLIEAFLYEEQTRRGVSLAHWAEFEDVADHCTICHKCEKPCPVDIDFGDVSIKMRNLLRKQGKKSFNPGKAAAMAFLTIKDPATIKAMRVGMMDWGYKAQRFAHELGKKFGLVQPQVKAPPATLGKAPIKAQVIHFINKPMPGKLPKRTSRALLDIEDDKVIPVIRDPHKANGESDAVFYFPGCGSERLFSQVGLATQAMLYHVGAHTVLPPGYLCCGYPQTAAGEEDKGQKITT